MKHTHTDSEFYRPVPLEKIPAHGLVQAIEAKPAERELLAKRFELLELRSLTAEFRMSMARGGSAVAVEGTLDAELVQACVVTLEPLVAKLTPRFKMYYLHADDEDADDAGPISGPNDTDEDDTEILNGKVIDLGELAAQYLALAIDPYPRKPDLPPVKIAVGEDKNAPKIRVNNPFALLAEKTKEK